MPHQPDTLIVLADAEHARLVRHGPAAGFVTVETLDSGAAGLRAAELVSDRQGRSFESASPTRHSIAARHDPREGPREAFARAVAARIGTEKFARLLLVAPARTLALIEGALDAGARGKLGGTLDKDLLKTPDAALAEHLLPLYVHLPGSE
jgi:protein required for attachment to host cells